MLFLKENGLTIDDMKLAEETVRSCGIDYTKIYIGKSVIQGHGAFAWCPIEKGEEISIAHSGEKWTICGRYANHSPEPNAIPMLRAGMLVFVASRRLLRMEEITVNYRAVKTIIEQMQEEAIRE